MTSPVTVDLALVGGGGAASLVLAALDRHHLPGVRVAIVDPVHKRGQDRTWAFWGSPGTFLDPLLSAAWDAVDVITPGAPRTLSLRPLRYAMLRSAPLYDLAGAAEQRLGAIRLTTAAGALDDDGSRVVVRDERGAPLVDAGWVLDSRPCPPARSGRTHWLQHFRGWWLESARPLFDPRRAVLMDFRTPQPPRGVSFGYVLPVSDRFALVEYTEFSPSVLSGDEYDTALRGYLTLLGIDESTVRVAEVENGVIPMTDGVFEPRPSPRVVRLGTAGGATRPSTGFTFTAMARQADRIAGEVAAGRPPLPGPAYPARHRWMDAVQLRALDRGLTDGVAFFGRLFDRNPPERVLRFLDGATSWREDLTLMASAPLLPMMRAAAGDAAARLTGGQAARS
ncbi:lycopene cyclase [Actinoplanes philippinensis]|uniref:Lycopene beta-cyclase n=1 Tax=Actinoplanes philippinensis TaxID=35752 RepID=A0A1I2NCP1_9ACTN|nr:lycopene cyclase family protein [Actinoplanes philippinensis]GIE83499.1 lycopene cyclase [Actinoplanes philippinensis]SFG01512.1 lycopene beta-cyclase [Actinoplanes philippinensis]